MYFLNLFAFLLFCYCDANTALERSKRYIYFPYGGGYKLVIGIGIPIMIPAKHQTLIFAQNIQFQYPQITNITQIQGGLPPVLNRKRRFVQGNEYMITYKAIELLINKYGMNGKQCLLRAICENAMYTLHHEENGLYGQLLHIILTPNYGSDEINAEISLEYIEAKQAGDYGVDCFSMYSECKQSILELFTNLE